jgi:DNA-directed RNA polymerase specialized sigma24 family protein
MESSALPNFSPTTRLDQIDTDWSMIHEPAHLVMRYANAVQRYLGALIKNKHDAEEVAQDFFLWVSQHGLPRARRDRGRFRDYLKKVVRNNALNFLRRKQYCKPTTDLERISAPEEHRGIPDQEWVVQWRRCLLRRTWRRLAKHEQRSPGNLAYTVLKLCADHPQEDSSALAARASQQTGKPLRADAFRKQMSRARGVFAQFLVKEVAATLTEPTTAEVEEELADLGLMTYVRDFLPLRRKLQAR